MVEESPIQMNELDYIEYVKSRGDVRMLLDPLYVRDLVDVDDQFYKILDEYMIASDLGQESIYNSLQDSPLIIDINSNGDIIFLYTIDTELGQELAPFVNGTITYDSNYRYIRPSDLDQIITLRDDFQRL